MTKIKKIVSTNLEIRINVIQLNQKKINYSNHKLPKDNKVRHTH